MECFGIDHWLIANYIFANVGPKMLNKCSETFANCLKTFAKSGHNDGRWDSYEVVCVEFLPELNLLV